MWEFCGKGRLAGSKGIRGFPGGEGYNSVGFFEEFIWSGGSGERMLVAVGIMSLEEPVEDGGYVGHW